MMSKKQQKEDAILGKCCKRKSLFIVEYDGRPSTNYSVLICKYHMSSEPFNKNILKTERINNA